MTRGDVGGEVGTLSVLGYMGISVLAVLVRQLVADISCPTPAPALTVGALGVRMASGPSRGQAAAWEASPASHGAVCLCRAGQVGLVFCFCPHSSRCGQAGWPNWLTGWGQLPSPGF